MKIKNLGGNFAGDLKIFNILAGIMSCSSRHACYICEAKKIDGKWERNAPLRTYASGMQKFLEWLNSGGETDNAKEFMNCIAEPIFVESNPEFPFILYAVPPPLHLKLSINQLLTQLAKVWPGLDDWLISLNVKFEPYHGA